MTAGYRVLVTGSRDWPDPHKVAFELNEAFDRLVPGGTLTVVHGACPQGADFDAHAWCLRRVAVGDPVVEEKHRADWITHRKGAGFVRNAQMVSLGADVCLAFIAPCSKPNCRKPKPHGSHGATDCADRAYVAGIDVRRFP